MSNNNFHDEGKLVGVIEVIHADSEGNILHRKKSYNAIDKLNEQVAGGLFNGKPINGTGAISAGLREFYDGAEGFVTTNTDYHANASKMGGIGVFNTNGTNPYLSGTILACTTVSGASSLNYFQVSGSCSFNAAQTAGGFLLGGGGANASLSPGWGTLLGAGFSADNRLCSHVQTFAYSSGDTLTVNWAATVTS